MVENERSNLLSAPPAAPGGENLRVAAVVTAEKVEYWVGGSAQSEYGREVCGAVLTSARVGDSTRPSVFTSSTPSWKMQDSY